MRTKTYTIIRPATGSWVPLWSQGWRVSCQPPCTDEPRIRLACNDVVRVTRWKKHWLFGEKVVASMRSGDSKDGDVKCAPRGWFPRQCAIELIENDYDDREYFTKQQAAHLHSAKEKKRK